MYSVLKDTCCAFDSSDNNITNVAKNNIIDFTILKLYLYLLCILNKKMIKEVTLKAINHGFQNLQDEIAYRKNGINS